MQAEVLPIAHLTPGMSLGRSIERKRSFSEQQTPETDLHPEWTDSS